MSSSFLQSSSLYASRRSITKVVEQYNLLVPETKAYIREAGFEPIIDILLEKSASAPLVQCLIKRWWDTTHTFHIVDREMTMSFYDFYRMTDLSLDSVLGI